MNNTEPPVVFVREGSNERWRIESTDFGRLRSALGPDVTNAFCRCFVHADRLTSLIGFAFLSEKRFGRDSPPFQRDLQTMVWFTVGTLRELALAIRDLRSALVKRGKLEVNAAPWVVLRDVERRWEDDAFYRSMRNIVAFHVDPEMTEKGLEALTQQKRVVLIRGEGRPQRHTFLSVGLEALFMGSPMGLADFQKFMASVGEDQAVGGAVEEAFVLALNAVGLPFHEERPGA